MSAALYIISNEYREAAAKLAELDLDEQTLADTLESIGGELEAKAQAVAYMARNLEVTAEAITAHCKAQQERAKAIQNRADSMRAYLQRCMEATGVTKIEGPGIAIGFRKSSAVIVTGADLLPSEFMRQPETPPPQPDKAAIKAAIAAGREVPGAHIEHRQTLTIK